MIVAADLWQGKLGRAIESRFTATVSFATQRSPSDFENFISHAFPENSPKWILWHYPAYLMLGWLWQGNLFGSTSIIAEESGSHWKLMLLQTLTFTYHHYVPCCALCASPLCLCAARTDGNENDFRFVKVFFLLARPYSFTVGFCRRRAVFY